MLRAVDWDSLLRVLGVVNFVNTLPHVLGRAQSVMFVAGT
jgi:hypothetical protein